jgi:hypothetical protein
MQVYTFFKHDGSGQAPSFDLMEFETFAAAQTYARGLLASRPNYRRVEVCDGLSDPAVVERSEP